MNRYTHMTKSKQLDIDKEPFPDPLSISFNNILITAVPKRLVVEPRTLLRWWAWAYDIYNDVEFDDIWLFMNGIPYVGMLEPGDVLYQFVQNDIENFNIQKLPNKD